VNIGADARAVRLVLVREVGVCSEVRGAYPRADLVEGTIP
jgi:hypothetical protein